MAKNRSWKTFVFQHADGRVFDSTAPTKAQARLWAAAAVQERGGRYAPDLLTYLGFRGPANDDRLPPASA